jgi:hypothetical protein
MSDDAVVKRADEELTFLIEARTKMNRFIDSKTNRNSHDPEDPGEIEYQEAKADWNAFRRPWREIRQYLADLNQADDQGEPADDDGSATTSPEPISASTEGPQAQGVAK